MKFISLLARCVLAVFAFSGSAQALLLADVTSTFQSTDPTQLGRLSRNGVPSDWSATKAFPGITSTTTTYEYETFAVNAGNTPYIQISIDDPNTRFFGSAYLGTYDPNNKATNYLGDAGFSSPFGNPAFFQLNVTANSNLVILINDVTALGGIGQIFHLLVEGFVDTQYTDPVNVPEPSIALLMGTGLALLVRKPGCRAARNTV